ncbi:hypothetical protein DFH09DRAFT_1138240 [Mycena vulgaris]|nr:hypothetical protein DFH09DRAFT_1138240 [Mycena vulgaris]
MLDSSPSATFPSNNPLTASFINAILVAVVAKSLAAAAVPASAMAETTVSKVAASASFARKLRREDISLGRRAEEQNRHTHGSGRTKPTDRMLLATSFICAMLSWRAAASQAAAMGATVETGAATVAAGAATGAATGAVGAAAGAAHADNSVVASEPKSARSKSMLDSSPSATFPSNNPLTASFTNAILDEVVAKSLAAAAVPASAMAETTVSKVAASASFARKGSGRTKPTDRIWLATSFICPILACTAAASQPPATWRVNFCTEIGAATALDASKATKRVVDVVNML